MGELIVNPTDKTVQVRGIAFPVDCIHAAMIETGGTVVANKDLNARLDRAMYEYIENKGKVPDLFIVESEPGIEFIPRRINLHASMSNTDMETSIYLYFAKSRLYHA